MADNETFADVLAAMRDEGRTGESSCLEWVGAKMRHYADRLEAAHKREVREAVTDCNQFSDAAKLREALKLCVDEMCDRCRDLAVARGNPLPCLSGCEPVRKAKAALAAPPRNCDVGTSTEQSGRMSRFCLSVKGGCIGCPMSNYPFRECVIKWAQMPYVASEKGEVDDTNG